MINSRIMEAMLTLERLSYEAAAELGMSQSQADAIADEYFLFMYNDVVLEDLKSLGKNYTRKQCEDVIRNSLKKTFILRSEPQKEEKI